MRLLILCSLSLLGLGLIYRPVGSHIHTLFDTQLQSLKQTTTIYKSTDARGQVNFSDQPPENGTESEAIYFQSNSNVIPAPDLGHTTPKSTGDIAIPLPPNLQPQRIKQLFDDANTIEGRLHNRNKTLESKLQ